MFYGMCVRQHTNGKHFPLYLVKRRCLTRLYSPAVTKLPPRASFATRSEGFLHQKLENFFLNALSAPLREEVLAACTPIPLPIRTSLYKPEKTPEFAYFPTSGVASVVSESAAGESVEVGFIGREGLIGSLHLMGPAPVPTEAFVQMEGTGLRIPFAKLKRLFHSNAEIHARLLEFVQVQALILSQIASCNRIHEANERLARWLLTAQDRTQSDVLDITQEFLAMMLGARRPTVSMVAGALQRSGLIEYNRGRVTIPDREKLEAAACDCYKVTKALSDNLYKQTWVATT
jgi:CRP-like cAMP-binding protein